MQRLNFEKTSTFTPLRVSFIPMIDVVLQIICFYLFVSAGVQSYQDTTVRLPTMINQQLESQLPAALTINLAADGSIDLNGEVVAIENLRARLAGAKASTGGEQFIVAIRADRRQRYGALNQILQICVAAEVPTVAVRSQREEIEEPAR